MGDEIWVPITKTKATVTGGDVKVWDEMEFAPRRIAKPGTGFERPPQEGHHDCRRIEDVLGDRVARKVEL